MFCNVGAAPRAGTVDARSQWPPCSGGHRAAGAYELDAAVQVPAVDHVVRAEVRQQHASV